MTQEIRYRVKVKLAVRFEFERQKGESEGLYSTGPEYAKHIQYDATTGPITPAAIHYQLSRKGISVGTVALHGRKNELDPRVDRLCVFETFGTQLHFRNWHVVYEEVYGQFDAKTGEQTVTGYRDTEGYRWLFLTFQQRSGASSRETLEPLYRKLRCLNLHPSFELTSNIRLFLPKRRGEVCLATLKKLTALVWTYEDGLDCLHRQGRGIPFLCMRLDSALAEECSEIFRDPSKIRDAAVSPSGWFLKRIFKAQSVAELVELTGPGDEFLKENPTWVEKYNYVGATLGWITFQQHMASLVPGNILAWAEVCACLVRFAARTRTTALMSMLKLELDKESSDEETYTDALRLLRTIGCPQPAYQRFRKRFIREAISPSEELGPASQPEPADEPEPMDLD